MIEVDEIYRWGKEGSAAVRTDLGEPAEGEKGSDTPATFTVPLEELHEWARDVPGGWDTTNVMVHGRSAGRYEGRRRLFAGQSPGRRRRVPDPRVGARAR
eukprot:1737276-Prymnesium_polylepis.1